MAFTEYFDGDQKAENDAYEFNAPYDYIREVNAGMDDPQAGYEEYTEQDHIDAWKREGWTDEEIEVALATLNEPVEYEDDFSY